MDQADEFSASTLLTRSVLCDGATTAFLSDALVPDASFRTTKSVLDAYPTMGEQQRNLVLRTWRRGVTTIDQLAPPSKQ